jgi:hypothetical protein
MNVAEKPTKLTTSKDFEKRLFSRLDDIGSHQKQNYATIFTLSEVRKYAAIALILILNISAVLFYTKSTDDDQSIDDITQYSDEYFPDYTILTSLE